MSESQPYPFHLEKSPKQKGTCPQCGHAKQFRYYEDNQGNRLEDFGRCERINACGYHIWPTGKSVPKVDGNYTPPPEPKQIYPGGKLKTRFEKILADRSSNFHLYAQSLGIPDEHLAKWQVGSETLFDKGFTVFVHVGFFGAGQLIVNAKWFAYGPDGKRLKDKKDDEMNSFSLKQPDEGERNRYGFCLYGEHLLDTTKTRPVMIVESEKTAVLASWFYPNYDWVACGACTGLTDAKVQALIGRDCYWLADADAAGRKNSSINKLRTYQIKHMVVDLFPDRNDGYDVADALRDGVAVDPLSLFTEGDKKPAVEHVPQQKKPSKQEIKAKAAAVEELFTAVLGEGHDKAPKEKYKPFETVNYRDSGIWIWGTKNWICVADNFQIFVKYCTEDENEEKTWILEVVVRGRKEPIYIEITHDEFCSATKLKNKLASHRLALKLTDAYLGELWQHLFKMNFPQAQKVMRLGYHTDSGVFFFANRAVNGNVLEPDEFGIVTAKMADGTELCLSMPVVKKKRQHLFTLKPGDMTFNVWFSHLVQIHKYDNAIIPACFYLMSLFRDLIVKHTSASPILYLKGGASSGKSSLVRSLCRLFNLHEAVANLKSKNTEAGLVRVMSQASNSLIWMDEYNNEFPFEGLLQSAYDDNGYIKADENSSSGVDTVDIFSALALTSNYIPENPIFFSRCVFVPIVEQQKTDEQVEAFARFRDVEQDGLSCVTLEMLAHRPLIAQGIKQAYDDLYNALKEAVRHDKPVERLISNMARVLCIPYVLQVFGKIQLHFEETTDDEVLAKFVEIGSKAILRQHQVQSEKTALSEFFELMQNQYEQGGIQEDVHFRFEGDLIFLRFPSLYTIYAQRYRQTFWKAPADRDTLKQEMIAFEGANEPDKFFKNIRFMPDEGDDSTGHTRSVSGSCAMSYSKLSNALGIDWRGRRLEKAER